LTNTLRLAALAEQINHNTRCSSIASRLRRCRRVPLPNFVTVDYYDHRDVMNVVAS